MKNAFYLLAAYPLRSLGTVALIWAPVILFFMNARLFMQLTTIILLCWYSVAGLFSVIIMRKPFEISKEHYLSTHNESTNPAPPEA